MTRQTSDELPHTTAASGQSYTFCMTIIAGNRLNPFVVTYRHNCWHLYDQLMRITTTFLANNLHHFAKRSQQHNMAATPTNDWPSPVAQPSQPATKSRDHKIPWTAPYPLDVRPSPRRPAFAFWRSFWFRLRSSRQTSRDIREDSGHKDMAVGCRSVSLLCSRSPTIRGRIVRYKKNTPQGRIYRGAEPAPSPPP